MMWNPQHRQHLPHEMNFLPINPPRHTTPLPRPRGSIKDKYRLNVHAHEFEHSPENCLFDGIGFGHFLTDCGDLGIAEVVETPACFVDCDA
jgi:hypothetical protein